MNILPEISVNSNYLEEIYKDLHSHPELGFEEERTSKIVQEKLKEFGVDEIHTEIGKTGVVGIIRGNDGKGNRTIGLPSDIFVNLKLFKSTPEPGIKIILFDGRFVDLPIFSKSELF